MKKLKPRLSVPYAEASAGAAARNEVTKILSGFGCEKMGFADDFEKAEVVLAFEHRGRVRCVRARRGGPSFISRRIRGVTAIVRRVRSMSRRRYAKGILL
jgi:hypothetical protein